MSQTAQLLHAAIGHHQAGELPLAEALYRQIIAQEPAHAEALHLLGLLAYQTEKNADAIEWIGRAVACRPSEAKFHRSLGLAQEAAGQLDGAVASYMAAIAHDPHSVEAHKNLAHVLVHQRQYEGAMATLWKIIALAPQDAEAYNALADVLKDMGHLDHALAAARQAITLRPDFAEAHNTLGNILCAAGQLDEAIAAYRQAVALKPQDPRLQSNLVYTLHFNPAHDARAILREAQAWSRRHADPLRGQLQPHANDRSPERPLRIGYLSPDFREHCQALFTLPVLQHHDHKQFAIHCYSAGPRHDAFSRRLRAHADVWRPVAGLSDDQVAQSIRADGIDILVDLTMHMAGNRLPILARKPAPVQVSWLAYPGTTGLHTIDYRLTDPYLDPPGADESAYAEQTLRLPDTFWCYDPLTDQPEPGTLPALANGFITFGCLNNFCKVNSAVLALWARVLLAVPRSRLIVLVPQGRTRERTLACLKQHGVVPERVECIGRQDRDPYLQVYQRIDIGLDTLPYNGHTTSLDSFWMGVPVLTLIGQTVVGRAGWCQLNNLGLPELAATTAEQAVRIAADLAGDLHRLENLRATLRARMTASPLMDAPRFARNIEAAYRRMWQTWCARTKEPA